MTTTDWVPACRSPGSYSQVEGDQEQMNDYRIATTPDLRFLNNRASGLNRAARASLMDRLDEGGLHVLDRVLAFMNDGSVHRCLVMAKIEGSDEPVEFYLDIEETYWQRLRTEAEIDAMVGSVP